MPSTVAHYMTLGEAEVAISALEAADIECILLDDNFIALQWFNANALGWVKVVVPDEDLLRAAEVLGVTAVVEEPPRVSDVSEKHCPRCGSIEVHRTYYRRVSLVPMLMVPLLVFAPLVLFFFPRWKCDNCGRRSWVR